MSTPRLHSPYKPDPLFKQRLGRFLIAEELLDAADPEMQTFFGNFVILDARKSFGTASGKHYEYTAFSSLFEAIPASSAPPLYRIECRVEPAVSGEERPYSFTATRI